MKRRDNIFWFYRRHLQHHVDTFLSAGLTTTAIVLVLQFMDVLK